MIAKNKFIQKSLPAYSKFNTGKTSILNWVYFRHGEPVDQRQRAQLENEVKEGAIQLPASRWPGIPATSRLHQRLLSEAGNEG